ncbi:ABC transporter permease subunit [bacterium]|nr:ABC transporter permease subunit [bacterium]
MNKILAIAFNTYKEAIRNKVFYIILLFAIGLLLFSFALATLSLGNEDRIIKDIGLSAINIFGLLIATFVGVNLVYDELERRTIYTIIASGVTRTEFILGKFLGLFITIVVNVAMMGFLLCLLISFWPGINVTASLILAMYLFLFEMMVIIAVAVLFSSFSTPVLSAILTFMCWVIGHMSEDLWEWSRHVIEDGSVAFGYFLRFLYFILPNLEIYNIKNQVVHQEDLGFIPYLIFLYPLAAIVYSGILMWITNYSFAKRDFK